MPTADDFRAELNRIFREAQEGGLPYVDVKSGDLHRKLGGYPGRGHQMPTCCSVMWSIKGPGDEVISQPPSGKGASLEIRYRIPRQSSQSRYSATGEEALQPRTDTSASLECDLERQPRINRKSDEAEAFPAPRDLQEKGDPERVSASRAERDSGAPRTPRIVRTASQERRWVRLREDPTAEFETPRRGCLLLPPLHTEYRFKSDQLEAETQLKSEQYDKVVRQQEEWPVAVVKRDARTWWMYKGRLYWEDKGYAPREVQAIIEGLPNEALHPHSFAEFLGQDQTKERLREMIDAAESQGRAMGHVLICGPTGTGKQALVRALAYEMDVPILGTIRKILAADLLTVEGGHRMVAQHLSALDHKQVLRVADIGDRDLKPAAIEVLCQAMLRRKLNLPQSAGSANGTAEYDLSATPFTLVATARRMNAVPESLLVLFHRVVHLTPYTVSELSSLTIRGAEVLRLDIEGSAVELISKYADGRTGLAIHLLERAGQFASAIESETITEEIAQEVLWRLGLLTPATSAAEEEPFERIAIPGHVRQAVLARDDYLCRYCGRRSQTMEVDHIIPVSQGGKSTLRNLVTACRECNRRKAARTPEEAGMDVLSVRTQRRDWE